MTTVNSPACLLACNHFYRSLPSSSEPMEPTFSCQNESQRPVALGVTMTTPPGLPVVMGTTGLRVNLVLRSSSSLQLSASKPTNPADRRVR